MASASTTFRVEVLTEDDWLRLRGIRLSALKENPQEFLSSFEVEDTYAERKWRSEFARGEWVVIIAGDEVVGVLGATRESVMPSYECYLEYLWVSPGFRESGAASLLLKTVLDRLRDSGVITVWLWILDGNDPAMRLYEKFGFEREGYRKAHYRRAGEYVDAILMAYEIAASE